MSDFTVKRGDNWPPIDATLLTNGDEGDDGAVLIDGGWFRPIDLSDAESVALRMKSSTVQVVAGPVTVNDPATDGTVHYEWEDDDLAVVGEYRGEWEITWADAKIETVPNGGYFTISVIEDLG